MQEMNSAANLNKRGRAYLCRRCKAAGVSVVDRRGRMVGHILKHHIPLDKVPFSCSLCMFKAMDQRSLIGHLTKYSRHVKLARDIGVIDHSQFLKTSVQPAIIGDADMVALCPEESARLFARKSAAPEDPLEDFDDDWEFADRMTPPFGSVTPARRTITATARAPTCTATNVWDGNLQTFDALEYAVIPSSNTVPQLGRHTTSSLVVPPSWNPVVAAPTIPPISVSGTSLSEVWEQLPTSGKVPVSSVLATRTTAAGATLANSTLGTCRKPLSIGTPLYDEGDTFLGELLRVTDDHDPLLQETRGSGSVAGKRNRSNTPVSEDQSSTKKARTEEKDEKKEGSIAKAIEAATQQIVDAIDRNTRAARARDTTLEKVVDELQHLSRVIARNPCGQKGGDEYSGEPRAMPASRGKENRMKSVVSKKR